MCKRIPLTKGEFTIIDDADFDLVSKWKWFLVSSKIDRSALKYAGRNEHNGGKKSTILLHRVLTGVKPGLVVDHIDGDGLNNQRGNLRICTHQQNISNSKKRKNGVSSGYIGVHHHSQNPCFVSQIRSGPKTIHLGCFKNAIDAAKAYDSAALRLRGKYARLNFPNSEVSYV